MIGRGARPTSPAVHLALAAAVTCCAAAGCSDPEPRSRSSPTVYVTSGFDDWILALDASTGELLDTLHLDRRFGEPDEPHGVAVDPAGRHLYATLSHGQPSLWKFELPGHRLVGRLDLDLRGAARIRILPGGAVGYVPDFWRSGQGEVSDVAVVDLEEMEIIHWITECPAPHDALPDAEGKRLAIICPGSGELVTLNLDSRTQGPRFELGGMPMNAAWDPDPESGTVYISLKGVDSVAVVHTAGDLHAGGRVRRVPVGKAPTQLEATPDGRRLVVANRGDRTVSVLDLTEFELPELHRVELPGEHPHGVAISADGATAYVTWEGTTATPGGVAAIDLASGRILWSREAGSYVLGVAVTPDSPSA
jgi:DNA-binding beta-propeller fold protein YncE